MNTTDKWIVVGHSMGGYIALAIADIYPELVEKVILVHSHPFEDNPARRRGRYKSLADVDNSLEEFIDGCLKRVSRLPLETLRKYVKFHSADVLKKSILAMADRPPRVHILMEKETLIVDGAMDDFLPRDQVKKELVEKGLCKYALIQEACHMSMLETPDALLQALMSFLH